MTPDRDPGRLDEAPAAIRRWERWLPGTIGVVAVALSLLLAAMLWFVQRSVERASALLVQGEALQLAGTVHDVLRATRRPPSDAELAALLAELEPRGLRALVLLRPDGKGVEAAAGQPVAPLDRAALEALSPMDPVVIGDRIRVLAGPPVRMRERHPGRPQQPLAGRPSVFDGPLRGAPDRDRRLRSSPDRDGRPPWPEAGPGDLRRPRPPGPPRPPPRLVLEFVPIRAADLNALAARTSWVGFSIVPAFLLGALFLAQLVRQREDLARRLEHGRRLAALGEMTAVIAHEIRNPLASLKGHAQLLERSLDADPRQGKAELVVREAVRLQDLVSDLLEFSRTGHLEIRPSDPGAVLRESAESIPVERIALRVDATRSWPLDPARMRQALSNVLRNAAQASPDGTLVDAAVFCEGPDLVFEVRDRGPGIPPGEEERIFEPFHTSKARGTGLGLPLVRRIVRQHGGTVTAANHPAGGAVLRITLPRGG